MIRHIVTGSPLQLCSLGRRLHVYAPDGRLRDDHTSLESSSGLSGGQLMTGAQVLAQVTGPKPLLRPATATNTSGIPRPSYCN